MPTKRNISKRRKKVKFSLRNEPVIIELDNSNELLKLFAKAKHGEVVIKQIDNISCPYCKKRLQLLRYKIRKDI